MYYKILDLKNENIVSCYVFFLSFYLVIHIILLIKCLIFISGSPFKIEVVSTPAKGQHSVVANGEGLKQGLVGSMNAFDIDTNGLEGNIEVRVTGTVSQVP